MMRLSFRRPTPTSRLRPGRSARRAMTLIEVMTAMAIVTSALLGFGAFIARFMHATTQADMSSVAMDLAVSRVELVKAWPTYATLETTFNGTQTSLANCLQCTMTTLIVKDSTAITNYKTVTVKVVVPNLSSSYTAAPIVAPLEKTTVIAAF